MGKEIISWIDGRYMSFKERMEEMYNNDMKSYFQKEYRRSNKNIFLSFDFVILK